MLKHILTTVISLLCALAAGAGSVQNYTFTSYNSDFGFVQKEVMKILQDRNGQMWFATWDGLYRFDGYRFSNYKARPGDGIRLESNRLEDIAEDGDNIWMRGYNGSVSRFSKLTDKIDNLPLDGYTARNMLPLEGGGVIIEMTDGRVVVAEGGSAFGAITTKTILWRKGMRVNKIAACGGSVWILTSSGVWRYDNAIKTAKQVCSGADCLDIALQKRRAIASAKGGRYIIIANGKTIIRKLPTSADISSVALLDDGTTLFATMGDGLYRLSPNYTVDRHITSRDTQLSSDYITELRKDSRGDVWFCTNKPGVMHYEWRTAKLKSLHLNGEFSGDPPMWRNGVNIVEDKSGNLWLTPSGNGMAMYDRKQDCLVPFLDTDHHYAWTAENTVIDIFVDRQQNVWFCGKYTGLQKATYNKPQFQTISLATTTESGLDVRGVFQDSKGRIWLGAKNGVVSVYSADMKFIGNLTMDGQLSKAATAQVGHAYAFAEEKNGTIWIGTKFNGLLRLIPQANGSFGITHYTADGGEYSLPHNDIFSLCIDKSQRLWIATFGGGLAYADLKSNAMRFIHAGNRMKNFPSDKFNRCRFVTEDSHGSMWVCTSSGLLRFSSKFKRPEDLRFKAYTRQPDDASSLSYNDVLEVFFTKQDSMYLCTYGGGFCHVERCQGDSLRFRPVTTADGLRSDVLFSVQEDAEGNLWFASENGFVRYSPGKNSVENFSSRYFGKQIDINEGQSLHLQDGRLFFPSRNFAAVYFRPEKIRISKFVPKIILTDFYLGQTQLLPSDDNAAILHQDINKTERITLPPGNNSFTLEFAALDFRDPSNISYAFKLDGFDKEWNMSGNRHSAIYNSLPPGTYTLKIRSTNSDGVWVSNERSIIIEVEAPFWQTGWALLLYVALAAAIIIITTYVLTTILRLKQKVAVEQEISDLKMKFFTNISHEIRTPLTLISGSIKEILRRGVKEKPLDDALQVVNENSDHLLRLVTQILDIRKIENGKMGLALRRTEMGSLIEHIAKNFDNLARERNIRLTTLHPDEKLYAWVDTEKIQKVVFNLVSNAFRFTPSGKKISVGVKSAANGGITLTVSDEGKGIAASRQKEIFQLFSSDSDGSTMHQPHSGIGLALTKDLVELHRGQISVESQLGQGSTFVITLPDNKPGTIASANHIMEDADDQDTAPYSSITESSENSKNSESSESSENTKNSESTKRHNISDDSRPTILIVEDNADMRRFIAFILQEEYNVAVAADGEEGLQKAAELQPDMIISDYMMPKLDGMKMAERMRTDMQTSHIPIIMLSARTDEGSIIKGLNIGVDAYIEKPFSADVLRARIANLIMMRKKLQEAYIDRFVNNNTADDNRRQGDTPIENMSSEKPQQGMTDADCRFMEKLTALLNENISNSDLGVDDVAQMMGMSRSVYFKKLKALTGIGPNDYLKQLRMQRAAEMLDGGEMPIADIAFSIGISDPHYFSKCFKQRFGMTPTEWKRRMKNEE